MIDSRFRREEKFRRISPKALVRLLDAQPTPEDDLLDSPGHVVGEPQDGAPLALVLDLRDAEAFETNRIVGAENYPAQTLTRTQNNLTPSILKFANKEPTHVIVIYDDDERTVRRRALVRRLFVWRAFPTTQGHWITRHPKGGRRKADTQEIFLCCCSPNMYTHFLP